MEGGWKMGNAMANVRPFFIFNFPFSIYHFVVSLTRPRPPRRNLSWMLSILLFTALLVMAFASMANPRRLDDARFAEALEISLSEITRGCAQGKFERIL